MEELSKLFWDRPAVFDWLHVQSNKVGEKSTSPQGVYWERVARLSAFFSFFLMEEERWTAAFMISSLLFFGQTDFSFFFLLVGGR